jgi:hypothetical protein
MKQLGDFVLSHVFPRNRIWKVGPRPSSLVLSVKRCLGDGLEFIQGSLDVSVQY